MSSSTKILLMPLSRGISHKKQLQLFQGGKLQVPSPRNMFTNLTGFNNWSSFAMR